MKTKLLVVFLLLSVWICSGGVGASAADPCNLEWHTFLGSPYMDAGRAIAVDHAGNLYIAGYSNSSWGTPIDPYAGDLDAFVAKIDNSGVLQWNTFLGSANYDTGDAIVLDGDGNVYVVGYSGGAWGTPLTPYAGGGDAFLAKLNSSGVIQWHTFLGGENNDNGWAVTLDKAEENVYVGGWARSNWSMPVNPFAGGTDGYVAKLNSNGVLQWNTFLGSPYPDSTSALVVDDVGNVYVGGSAHGTWGAPLRPYTGGDDALVAKLNSSGVLQWHTFLGSTVRDGGFAIALDGPGNVYITGFSDATWDMPLNPHAGGERDGFVAQLDSTGGVLQWHTFVGSTGTDLVDAITVGGNENIYVAGFGEGWGMPIAPPAGGQDAFVAQFDSGGLLQWHTFLGSSGVDQAYAITVGGLGESIYVTGFSLDWGIPLSPYVGGSDAFVAKLTTDTNQPPTTEAGGPYIADEGETVVVTASGSDPDGDVVTYTWDLDNDGTFETPGQSVTFSAAGLDGPITYPIAVQITDSGGLSATDQTTVEVLNVVPTVGAITAPLDPILANTQISASADFSDPGVLDTHSAVWEWGDGNTSEGSVDETNGSGSVTGSHAYATPGVYTVKLTVTDKDGASGESVFQYVVIYNPDGGFVTGGGWIDSPEGACQLTEACTDATGKASFGFVSKYKKGAIVPTGETEFQFKAGDLNFHSDSYEWLVVAGHKAKYKGEGTINGTGNYGFMLSAIDEKLTPSTDVDLFRIKIWDKDDDDLTVYDNQMEADEDADPVTAIGGGNIVIHKAK